jgi:hypothetical protein
MNAARGECPGLTHKISETPCSREDRSSYLRRKLLVDRDKVLVDPHMVYLDAKKCSSRTTRRAMA